jgi:uncharacterized protein (DUF2267 family)
MQYRNFIKQVQLNSGFSDSEAEQATEVFMETLASRLTEGELKDLRAQLPPEIAAKAASPAGGGLDKLRGDEFLEKIAMRQNIDTAHAKKQMRSGMRSSRQYRKARSTMFAASCRMICRKSFIKSGGHDGHEIWAQSPKRG